MGETYPRAHSTNGVAESTPIPPGFVSLTAFTLRKENREETEIASELESAAISVSSSIVDATVLRSSLRCRPWILHDRNNQTPEESDYEQLDTELPTKSCLPKGVIRGCPDSNDCVKVIARWDPKNGRNEFHRNAPVFHPTAEEFTDTVEYIRKIRPIAEPYGICRIVPPSSWQPPCLIKEENEWGRSQFVTKCQRIDGWQNLYAKNKVATSYITTSSNKRRKLGMGLDSRFDDVSSTNPDKAGLSDIAHSEPGPSFTLETFKKYADSFKDQYFSQSDKAVGSDGDSTLFPKPCKPSVESIESEYGRIVENPTEEVEVLYATDLKSGAFGSGFLTVPNSEMSGNQDYLKSGWNLSNTPRLPGSLLSFESCGTSGNLSPLLHIGMCFSSSHWKVEDHHLYSLGYMHFGDPKVWYVIPGRYAMQVEVALKKRIPNLRMEESGLRQKLIAQLSPSMLKSEGIPVYRCVHHQGEFVLVFPRAYHSGFDCGFNCAEVVNYAPIDWLPYGQNAVELYRQQRRRTSISQDKLLLGAAREAVRAQWEVSLSRKFTSDSLFWIDVCGKDGVLAEALKLRVKQESRRREYLCASFQSRKMDKNFDANCKRECYICMDDLHLSAVGCPCSPNIYSCLLHAKQLCSCASSDKIFLFRYDISELNVLVDAVEKKLSAVYKWAKEDMGYALNPMLSKENLQQKGQICGPTSSAKGSSRKEVPIPYCKDLDSLSSIKAEIKARLLQSTSLNNLKTKEDSMPSLAGTPLVRPERIGIETRLDKLSSRPGEEVATEVLADSTSTSSSSDYGYSLDVDFQFREKAHSVSPSALNVSICHLNKEDEDVPPEVSTW